MTTGSAKQSGPDPHPGTGSGSATGRLTDQAPADPGASDEQLATQPIGYWSGLAHRAVTRHLRDAMARFDVTQPQYWVLNGVSGGAGAPSREELVGRLTPLADGPHEIARVVDQLLHRGWLRADGGQRLHLTEAGEAARVRVRRLVTELRAEVHEGIGDQEYVAALKVLRRMVANVEGAGPDAPDGSPATAVSRPGPRLPG
ncbi:MarR family winged helix-turn-helix transcriptional regulator [Streptomyces sp. NPDC059534]|uniref:MarR family winged helix-turn-helix transcriptional regulator n=1 Tax=Streptomyces sp. NPDC059534 TaxID=3346859 RepID=UPI003689F4B7